MEAPYGFRDMTGKTELDILPVAVYCVTVEEFVELEAVVAFAEIAVTAVAPVSTDTRLLEP